MWLWIFLGVGGFILLYVLLNAINVLQNGLGGWQGRPLAEQFTKPLEDVTADDIHGLNKAQVMQVFYAAPAPEPGAIEGEYAADLVAKGIMAAATAFYTHHQFGPGRWLGKGFQWQAEAKRGRGYNLFGSSWGDEGTHRTRELDTYLGPSNIDQRPSLHLDYAPYNKGLVHSMHDEVRQINDHLFLGMGYMASGGGAINPAPFLLKGPPQPARGVEAG